jgi:hypothetical protein
MEPQRKAKAKIAVKKNCNEKSELKLATKMEPQRKKRIKAGNENGIATK